ncbi:iron chaperone [Cellulomonas sp. URHE0023]|uniref:iron chaperone n=1 Tax=Cellulomonas sp. URHE0023 TaxID=1380354 RepID=UPI00048283DF|nr:DUF1801 domain-containing protein [Cellulomonas sp. URHE0023]
MAETNKSSESFTTEERAAMKERAREVRRQSKKADGEADLLAKIAEMNPEERLIAERIHAIVQDVAPDLTPKTWYGQPAWEKDGKIVCFFQASSKFKTRYSTFGFNDSAALDDGSMWPVAFALTKLTQADEKKIAELVKNAVG